MKTLEALLHDGSRPRAESVVFELGPGRATLRDAWGSREMSLEALRVSPRSGAPHRFVSLPDGAQLQCPDGSWLDALPQRERRAGAVAWLETRAPVTLACVAAILLGGVMGLRHWIPALSLELARRIPPEAVHELGAQSIAALERRGVLQPSGVSALDRAVLRSSFRHWLVDLGEAESYRLEFRSAPALGPNAFAFPGRWIVVTDELIELSGSHQEVLAVLAHEVGHAYARHPLRLLIESSALAAAAAALSGDLEAVGLLSAGVPALLARAHYQRDLETDADAFALEQLRRRGISPEYFARILERLRDAHPERSERGSFFDRHPAIAERIARARAQVREPGAR